MSETPTRSDELFSKSLPSHQIAWDHTSLSILKECPRKYQLAIIEGWRPKTTAAPLAFGSLMHAVLEEYDRLQHRSPDASRDTLMSRTVRYALEITTLRNEDDTIKAFFSTTDSKRSRYNLVRAIVWYIDKFHDERLCTASLPNGSPALELSFRISLPFTTPDGTPYIYCGHIDKIGELSENLFVVERKHTTTTLSSYYFDRFSPSNQVTGYIFAANVMMQRPVNGALVDAMQIAEGFSRVLRAPITRTQEQVNEWLLNLGYWLRQARHYSEQDYFPMNEESCHKFSGCQFRGICRLAPGARQVFLQSNFNKEPWDPLKTRGEEEL